MHSPLSADWMCAHLSNESRNRYPPWAFDLPQGMPAPEEEHPEEHPNGSASSREDASSFGLSLSLVQWSGS